MVSSGLSSYPVQADRPTAMDQLSMAGHHMLIVLELQGQAARSHTQVVTIKTLLALSGAITKTRPATPPRHGRHGAL